MDFPPGRTEAQRGRLLAERLRRADFAHIRIRATFGSFAIPASRSDPITEDEHGLREEWAAMVALLDRCEVTVKARLRPSTWSEGTAIRSWRPYAEGLLAALTEPAWRRLDVVFDAEPTDSNLIIFGQREVWISQRSTADRRYSWTLRHQGPDVWDVASDFDLAFESSLEAVSDASTRGRRLLDARADLVDRVRDQLAGR